MEAKMKSPSQPDAQLMHAMAFECGGKTRHKSDGRKAKPTNYRA